jgi:alkanesulfonate monooxygenase SsuD/methylene tetrahydromethanopterin reductase-like flavin-dependent oxidoreductase (luciferase family)
MFQNPPSARVPWDELYRDHLGLIEESEALGFDHAWLSEHHFVDDGYASSVLPIAGAVAARTSRIRIGTTLLLLPLHNPVHVAEDVATLDVISGGRFDLGVGQGYVRHEFDGIGISFTSRRKRFEESLEVVRGLLSGETVTFEGEYVTVRGARISPPALQRPHTPIWVGAGAPKAIERVARMGFDYLSVGPESAVAFADALRSNGRDPADFRIANICPAYVAPTREQAWEIAAPALHHYATWQIEANHDYSATAAAADLAGVPTVAQVVAQQSFPFWNGEPLVGTPEDVIPRLEEWARAGITEACCTMALPGLSSPAIRASMELFAREVFPHFR